MNRINWRKEMLSTISSLQGRPRLLLHVCCAPCSSGCLEELCAHFDYNPNISPAEEYVHRGEELCRLVHEMPLEGSPDVVIADYDPETFYRIARGLEDVPEGGVVQEGAVHLDNGLRHLYTDLHLRIRYAQEQEQAD